METTKQYKSTLLSSLVGEISAKEQAKTDKRMRLAARIDDAMKAKDWKKIDLARVLNKRPSEITKWLSGTHNFSTETLFELDEVLETDLMKFNTSPAKEIVNTYKIFLTVPVKQTSKPSYLGLQGTSFYSAQSSTN